MTDDYYQRKDLKQFGKITDDAADQGQAFFNYYQQALQPGALSKREKVLIALAVAHTERCPYCIDAYTNEGLSLGLSRDEMMEAVHVGASMQAGVTMVHATQMQKIVKKKEMI